MGGVELGGVSTEVVTHGEQTVPLGGVFEDGEFKDKTQVSMRLNALLVMN